MEINYRHYEAIRNALGLGIARVYVSINDIRTIYYVRYERDNISFCYRDKNEDKEILLEDLATLEPIMGLTRSSIVEFQYSAEFSVLNIITDDYKYLSMRILDELNVLSITSPITDDTTNPNPYCLEDDRLTRVYLAHYLRVLSSMVKYGIKRKLRTPVYMNMKHFTPVLPISHGSKRFLDKYSIVLPLDLAALVNMLQPNVIEGDTFYWATHLELATFFNVMPLKFDMVSILELMSAFFQEQIIYIRAVPNKQFPLVMTEAEYSATVSEYPVAADYYRRTEYISLVLNDVNDYNEKHGYTKFTRANLKELRLL